MALGLLRCADKNVIGHFMAAFQWNLGSLFLMQKKSEGTAGKECVLTEKER